jgi:hypothetical protein
MMEYTLELKTIDPAHLSAGAESLNELARGRWKVITLVPFDSAKKSYLVLFGREREDREVPSEPLELDSAIIDELPAPAAN